MTEERKWTCSHCTYKNWPASKKCTICRAPNSSSIISTEKFPHDIYQLAPPVKSPDSIKNFKEASVDSIAQSNKWSCPSCTYQNGPRSSRCTQCSTNKPNSRNASLVSEKPLTIDVNDAGTSYTKSASRNNSPSNSPNSLGLTSELNNDKNRTLSYRSDSVVAKWSCTACTYDNWPKSGKCAICGTSRGQSHTSKTNECKLNFSKVSPTHSLERKNKQILTNSSSESPSQEKNEILEQKSLSEVPATSFSEHTSRTSHFPPQHSSASESHLSNAFSCRYKSPILEKDLLWLNACHGVVDENFEAVSLYISSGGDPTKQISKEDLVYLNRPSAFEAGYTLVHLAIRFHRENILTFLLTSSETVSKPKKRVPSHVSPNLASDILREISISVRQRNTDFRCYFLMEISTFALPSDIQDLPRISQKQLFNDLFDQDVQKELEIHEPVINWSNEITKRLGSRLFALWNRTSGDCLLDSILQATWGIFDSNNSLRRVLGNSLEEASQKFYARWKVSEKLFAKSMQFNLDENQLQQDWAVICSLATQPGTSLEQIHIFTLAHILRRPIIVYGVKFVKSFRGENLSYAKYQGAYLPLLWEESFCWRTPITLGYTRGHFSALVPAENGSNENVEAGANISDSSSLQTAYLPLIDNEGNLFPIHFLDSTQFGHEETLYREWMDCFVTEEGILVAIQKLNRRSSTVRKMMEEWIDYYRKLNNPPHNSQDLSSDGETDDE